MVDDLVVVVLEETFTPVERTLIERGEIDAIREIRHRFQMAMEVQFTEVIEAATGRKVRAFMSETDLDSDTSVEVFLLHTARTSAASDVQEMSPLIDATKAADEGEAAARDAAHSSEPASP
jgi:uncharacterized protein YbcI